MAFYTPLQNGSGCSDEHPDSASDRSPIADLLRNTAGMQPARPVYPTYKYLCQLFPMSPDVIQAPEGFRGWFPNRCRSIKIVPVEMDCTPDHMYYDQLTKYRDCDWSNLLNEYPFHDPADGLGLSPELKAMADKKPNGEYRSRTLWLRHQWELVRMLEENPGLNTATYQLSEVLEGISACDEIYLGPVSRILKNSVKPVDPEHVSGDFQLQASRQKVALRAEVKARS